MKAKTVWKSYYLIGVRYGLYNSEVWFDGEADVRWVNCFGNKIGDVILWAGSKIIGDSDD